MNITRVSNRMPTTTTVTSASASSMPAMRRRRSVGLVNVLLQTIARDIRGELAAPLQMPRLPLHPHRHLLYLRAIAGADIGRRRIADYHRASVGNASLSFR